MAAHGIGQVIIFCPVVSFFFLLFSSPNLSNRRLDVYHTSTHGVALERIYNLGLKCAARSSLEMQDPKNRQKLAIWAPSHAISPPKCSHNVVNFGPLATEICWRVWGTPANFNGFRVLAALLHGTLVVGVSQTLRVEKRAPLY